MPSLRLSGERRVLLFVIRATHLCDSGFPCPPFKVIILDEADMLTPDAQTGAEAR
jgi:DNA polymerase III delta prime subunit